ncbi:MAG: molybdopterin-dependent oxidoreductase [Chloroflexi bacterium]|nr:molybdopterin-dependent oxidoreductase [Chloroflexota bacterium]
MNNNNLTIIGKPLLKVDAMQKVTGETRYADDLSLPRMLYGKLLRSVYPHARIVGINTSRAEQLPGVFAVITGKALPIKYGIMPSTQDEEALCVDKVRFVGDPVAAVAAIDEETAERALELIDVEYEPLAPIMTIRDALDEKLPRIHGYSDHHNIHKFVSLEFGDLAAGFQAADHVREDTFFYEGDTHLPMEQHAAVAQFSSDGRLTLWSSTQTPHYVHRALEKTLEMPRGHIRVIATPVGGGFGGKTDPFSHEIAACKLSMLTGRPVKITLTREEVFYTHRGRHPVLMWVKSGVKRDGQITALHFKTMLDGGAYGSYGIATTYYTGALQTVTYKIPAYKFEGLRVFTNKPPCGPKRGHGTPQPRFGLEIHLDKIARDLGLDPAEMRRKYVVDDGTKTVNHLTITTCGLRECIDAVIAASGWREKRLEIRDSKSPISNLQSRTKRGLGLACSSYLSGAGLPIYWNELPHSGVIVKVDRGGGVAVFCGSTDIGQGSDSLLAYIAAEEFGLKPNDIHVFTADTDLTPVDLGSYSSRVTVMTGNACIQAARSVKQKILAAAAEKLFVPAASLVMRDGIIVCEDDENRQLSFVQAVNLAEAKFGTLSGTGSYKPPKRAGPFKGSGVGPSPSYSYAACVAAVSVDTETGVVTVDKLYLAHDAGRAINPLLVIGQAEGSAYMGLGEALMEESAFRKGMHKIPSMLDYKSPTTLDTPDIQTILVETIDPEGPYGAKEAGQGPLLPVPPAIANAVFDAVGVRIDEVPITPDKVLKALEEKAKGRAPRVGPKDFPNMKYPEPIKVEPPENAPQL